MKGSKKYPTMGGIANLKSRGTARTRAITMTASYIEEPLLGFADDNLHPDPKIGLSAFGPSSLNRPGKHPACISLGVIGTALTIENARNWIGNAINGFPGTEDDLDFPGCSEDAGFFTRVVMDDSWAEELSHKEIASVLSENGD